MAGVTPANPAGPAYESRGPLVARVGRLGSAFGPRSLSAVAGPTDMSELHLALDRLRPQVCHCGLKGECLGCKGIEMVRAQAEAVVAAAGQPILIQVAQEAAMKDMASRFQGMTERLMSDPEIRRSAEDMQQKLMSDPETRELLEELMRRLGNPPEA
ncbi:MAG: hypothetical protein QOI23_1247 [Chloroflexota bacterium]|nr:hypothetical protein [Chloroflexota bacterium]